MFIRSFIIGCLAMILSREQLFAAESGNRTSLILAQNQTTKTQGQQTQERTKRDPVKGATSPDSSKDRSVHPRKEEREQPAIAQITWKSQNTTTPPLGNSSELSSFSEIKAFMYTDHISGVAISPDGKQVITGLIDNSVILRNLDTGQIAKTWRHNGAVYSVAFSPDGRYVLTGSSDKTAILRDISTDQILHTWRHTEGVLSVAYSPDGKTVVTGSGDRTAVLRDVQTGRTLQTWSHSDNVYSVAFSPDGRHLLTGSGDKTAVLRDIRKNHTVQTWTHKEAVMSVAFSPNGKQVLTGSLDKTAVLRDSQTGQALKTWNHNSTVYSVAFSPNGRHVLTGSLDRTVVLRDVQTGQTLRSWTHNSTMYSAIFSPRGRQFLAAPGNRILVYELPYISFQETLENFLKNAEITHRILPKHLADRQTTLNDSKPIKDEFESNAQFSFRVISWNKAVDTLNADIQAHYARLGPLPLALRAKAFEEAIALAFGNPQLRDIRYDPESARFFAALNASGDPTFLRTISLAIPNDQARIAKTALESVENGLEVELQVTNRNELIWGAARVNLNGKTHTAQYTDKDFVPPATTAIGTPTFQTITPPPVIATLPQSPPPRVSDDPRLAKLQTEVLRREREAEEKAARDAEEKRLRERLAQLRTKAPTDIDDDLTGLLTNRPSTPIDPRLHVLAIGINDYADVPDVPFADRSAQTFAEFAKKQLGVEERNLIVLTNSEATLGRLRSRMRLMFSRLGPQDRLILYYAGHGVPSRDGKGAYLLAQDGGPGSYEEPDLKLDQLYAEIERSRVGQATLLIDACFSGRSGKDSIVFEGIGGITVTPKHNIRSDSRIAVLTAGRGDQFSNQEKTRGHRLFSYHLMKVLLEDGPKLTAAQLHARLRDRVLNDSRKIGPEFEQDPELLGNQRIMIKQ